MNSLRSNRSFLRLAAKVAVAGLALTAIAGAAIQQESWGKSPEGAVNLYTLKSPTLEVKITNYGGRVVSILVPDRKGKVEDVVAGYENLDGYLKDNPNFGAIVGRYANRIAHGAFTLNGHAYTLAKNNGENSLHGGLKGFDKKLWKAKVEGDSLVLSLLSKDGEEGFPGNLRVTVTYTVSGGDLRVDYDANTDKATVVNFTNHSYFRLAGPVDRDILNHEVTIAADTFTPVDKGLIPTGELRPVVGTPFDFHAPHSIGERINAKDEQLQLAGGYDHNFVLSAPQGQGPKLAARVREPGSGRILEVLTTEPGIQLYTGNSLDGTLTGHGGIVYKRNYALCLETQHYPDSPNHPAFPTTELQPGQRFRSATIYRFSTEK